MKHTANDNSPVPWYSRKLFTIKGKPWDFMDVFIGTFVICLPVAIVAGLVLQYLYPNSSWWVMSAIAFLIIMAG